MRINDALRDATRIVATSAANDLPQVLSKEELRSGRHDADIAKVKRSKTLICLPAAIRHLYQCRYSVPKSRSQKSVMMPKLFVSPQ